MHWLINLRADPAWKAFFLELNSDCAKTVCSQHNMNEPTYAPKAVAPCGLCKDADSIQKVLLCRQELQKICSKYIDNSIGEAVIINAAGFSQEAGTEDNSLTVSPHAKLPSVCIAVSYSLFCKFDLQ